LGGTRPAQGADNKPARAKEAISFGTLRATSSDEARTQALNWLKSAGKTDAAALKAFETIWAQTDRPVIDRVSQTLILGDAQAGTLLTEARNPTSSAPTKVPEVLKDAKKPAFYRANLALAYGKALSNRRVYEEALEAFKAAKVEDVVDPSAYLFHRAVAEHALLLKQDANRSILRLLDDATDAPDRYKLVSVLMALDMQSWRDKDLGWIARKMDNIERRLELARGGPKTQKIQKEVVARLDEIIKDLENKAKGNSNGGD
jgi:tetratricopeptide (TPR) repeat protein